MKHKEVLMKMWNDVLYDTSSSRREFDCINLSEFYCGTLYT